MRRARPEVLVARFGMRSKPRPFTSVAIFEDQHRISTLPDENDSAGSAMDAGILARYVNLAANRYPEYRNARVVCIAESAGKIWVRNGQQAALPWDATRIVSAREIADWLWEKSVSDVKWPGQRNVPEVGGKP